jgi:hypothetical protein
LCLPGKPMSDPSYAYRRDERIDRFTAVVHKANVGHDSVRVREYNDAAAQLDPVPGNGSVSAFHVGHPHGFAGLERSFVGGRDAAANVPKVWPGTFVIRKVPFQGGPRCNLPCRYDHAAAL